MAAELGSRDPVLCIPTRDSKDHLHDQCRRIAEHVTAKNYENARLLSERAGCAETVVPCVEECFQELAKHAALGCSLESVHPGVGGSDSSRTLVVAFRLVVDYTEIR